MRSEMSFCASGKDFLANGSHRPMSTMPSLLTYGKQVALNTGSSGNSRWSEDKKTFYLYGRPIVISQSRQIAREVATETETIL